MKIAFVTNLLTPYRSYLFDLINDQLLLNNDEFRVYAMCESKSDRPWTYNDLKRDYTVSLPSKQICISGFYLFFNKLDEINKFSPDIVICAGSYFLPTVIRLLLSKNKYNRKIYFWTESHEKEEKNHSDLFKYIRDRIKNYSLSKFDGFLYASSLAKEFVERYCNDNADFIYFPNTVNQDAFHKAFLNKNEYANKVRIENNIPSFKKILFTPARLSVEKGIVEFLYILNKLPSKENIKWIVAGDGPLKKEIQDTITKLGLDVCLVGQKSQEDIIKLLGAADIFILPSFSDPNPLTVIESLWAGKCIFISEGVGNQREALKSGVNGYLFSHKDVNDAVSKLENLINMNSSWFDRCEKASLDIAKETYDIHVIVEKFINLIKK